MYSHPHYEAGIVLDCLNFKRICIHRFWAYIGTPGALHGSTVQNYSCIDLTWITISKTSQYGEINTASVTNTFSPQLIIGYLRKYFFMKKFVVRIKKSALLIFQMQTFS